MEERAQSYRSSLTLQKGPERLPTNESQESKITIVGAGLSGLLMAIYLHRRGYRVHIYERRPDPRHKLSERNRSVNMTLSLRGFEALLQVGLGPEIERIATPLKGRVIHTAEGTMFQPYGKNDHEILYGVKRHDLNVVLLEVVEKLSNCTISFEERLVQIDKQHNILTFHNDQTGAQHAVQSDVTIGADGTFSAVRQQMFRGQRADYHQECLNWGYKELNIPVDLDRVQVLRRDGLHIWARQNCMLIGTPTTDKSFTCTCFMPFEGETSFNSLQTEAQVARFFSEQFKDLAPFIPFMVQSYMQNSAEMLVTTRCAPWYYQNRIVLIGDACHSVYPFYGQGMNAALEDCRVLDQCIGEYDGDWEAIFCAFQTARKRNTDILAELSKQNFIELSQKVNSHRFVARKKIDMLLNRLFPNLWIPLYTLVSHTTIPYADAVERVNKQNQRARLLGLNIAIDLVATMLAMKEWYTFVVDRFSTDRQYVTIPQRSRASLDHHSSTVKPRS